MPTPVQNASASGQPNVQAFSNALDDMQSPSFGPDQSTCRVKTLCYSSFDYGGKRKDDPVIAVEAVCEPLDGSNENKDFTVHWTCGPKASEAAIINDGGYLAPTVNSNKNALTNTSNWAKLLRSLADASYDTKQLNGQRGIRVLEGIEWTIRRIKRTGDEGIEKKEGERDREYYSCLKIDALPGEAKKGAAGRKATAKPAAAAAAAPAVTAAVPAAAAAAASNGAGAGSDKVVEYIQAAITQAGGTISTKDLARAVYKLAQADGAKSSEAMEIGKASVVEDLLIEHAMAEPALWGFDNGTLTAV